jgi:16S rRNA (guanine527-N7)-methyltransferase
VSLAVHEALEAGQRVGFLGDVSLDDQITHALGFAAAVDAVGDEAPRVVVDLGSGGGLPALVLVEWWSRTRFVLVEAHERRAEHLRLAVARTVTGDRVTVLHERAEVVGNRTEWRGTCDVVTARSFGRPAVTAECAAPFLRVGGLLVVSEPPTDVGRDRWQRAGCAELGLEPVRTVRVGGRFGYQVLVQRMACPERFPRRTGVPAKRPLF